MPAKTTFDESQGEIYEPVKIQKQIHPPETEVDIPIQMLIQNGSATVGKGTVYYYSYTA